MRKQVNGIQIGFPDQRAGELKHTVAAGFENDDFGVSARGTYRVDQFLKIGHCRVKNVDFFSYYLRCVHGASISCL